MENQLFRQESIDQVNSQEQIKDYLRVTSPKLWMVIAAVVILIGGFLAYMSAAEKEITVPVKVQVQNLETDGIKQTEVYFQIRPEERENYRTGMQVRFAGETGKIGYFIDSKDLTMVSVLPDNPQTGVADGEYDATVILETSTPIDELLK